MAKQRAFANQEREFHAQRLTRLMRAMLLLSATVLSFTALGLLAADQLYRPDTFIIKQLKIKGQFRHLDPKTIEAKLVDMNLGNFFSVELDAIKSEVEALDWVQRADVRREWPNTLELTVVEQRPVMRWGADKWVSSVGEVIRLPDQVTLADPIMLSGNEKDARRMLNTAFIWKKRLLASGLELKGANLSGSQAWTLTLFYPEQQATFELLLGREDVSERLSRFQYLFEKQFRFAKQKLQRVDARYPDGLAVRSVNVKSDDAVAANN